MSAIQSRNRQRSHPAWHSIYCATLGVCLWLLCACQPNVAQDAKILAQVGDDDVRLACFVLTHDRMQASPQYRGKQALLEQMISAILLASEAEQREITPTLIGQRLAQRQALTLKQEFLPKLGYSKERLATRWPLEIVWQDETWQAFTATSSGARVVNEAERHERFKSAVVRVGNQDYFIDDVKTALGEQRFADLMSGSSDHRMQLLSRFAEDRQLDLMFGALQAHTNNLNQEQRQSLQLASECLRRIEQRQRAQDLLGYFGLQEERK